MGGWRVFFESRSLSPRVNAVHWPGKERKGGKKSVGLGCKLTTATLTSNAFFSDDDKKQHYNNADCFIVQKHVLQRHSFASTTLLM